MVMYLLDIGKEKPNLDERDAIMAEDIIYNRDLIRGFTLSRITMIQYAKFMNELLGNYVDVLVCSHNVPDDLSDDQYAQLALKLHNKLFDGESLYASTCPEIRSYRIEYGDDTIATDSMIEQSTSVWEYESILEDLMVLFDDIFRAYVPAFYNNEIITEFKQFIMDGLLARKNDFFADNDGKYWFDVYAILKIYMIRKLFLGVRD